jgi:hypothetical protein
VENARNYKGFNKNYAVAKVIGRTEQVDARIARYLRALDRADRGTSSGESANFWFLSGSSSRAL